MYICRSSSYVYEYGLCSFFQATISVCGSEIIKDLHFNKQNKRESTSARIFGYCNEFILIRDFKDRLMIFFFDAMIWFMSKLKWNSAKITMTFKGIAISISMAKPNRCTKLLNIDLDEHSQIITHRHLCAILSPEKKIKENVTIFKWKKKFVSLVVQKVLLKMLVVNLRCAKWLEVVEIMNRVWILKALITLTWLLLCTQIE